jgi:multidrug efflux pump subunit AcrB
MPRKSAARVIAEMRPRLEARVPGLRVEFVQILQDMVGDLSGNPNPIEIKLFDADPVAVRPVAEEVARRIAAIPGVVDEFDGITEVGPTYDVLVDPRRAALAGLDAGAVQHWLETALTGTLVGSVLERERAIPLRLRYPQAFRDRLEALKGLTLTTSHGGLAPLAAIAELREGPVAVQREREDLRPLVRVTARLEGRDLGSTMRDVRRALDAMTMPPGVSLSYGGLYANQQRAFTDLLVLFAGSLACISVVLLVEFGTLRAAFAVVAGSALALAGSLTALWLTHTALNVSSIIGMIMVVGIVAKNGILLLDRAVRTAAHGTELEPALIEAARVRLRPIVMTSLAAAAGLAPLAAGIGTGAEMQQPLAIAILGGMAVSMVCSLIGVPLLYATVSRRQPPPIEAGDAPAGR